MGSWLLVFSAWLAVASAAEPRDVDPWAPDPSSTAITNERAPSDEPDDLDASSSPRDIGLVETVVVQGRLGAASPGPASARVQQVGGDDLRLGARSVPEALARLPVVQAVDQVGNGRQLSLDLRGFSGAEGATALVIDGIRLNDADTNVAAWEMLRAEDLDHVDIVAGPNGASLGGGAMAGAVHVVRRRPSAAREADVRLRAGRFGFRDLGAVASGPIGRWRALASAGAFEDDGFRADSGSRERAFRLAAERDLGPATLALGWAAFRGRWSQPGALRLDEMASNPADVPHNDLDVQDVDQHLLTARIEAPMRRTRFVGVVGFRDRAAHILSTGRSGYGYRTRDSQQSLSLAAEGETELVPDARWSLRVRWGGEAARERLHPRGWATDDVRDGRVDHEELSTATDLDWDRAAAFAGLAWGRPGGFGMEIAGRHDRSRVARKGKEVGDSGDLEDAGGRRSFADTTWRVGVGRGWTRGAWDLRWSAAWDQSFLAPSAIHLFAYPGYFSNPDLRPQRGAGPSFGLSARRDALGLELEVFETRVRDEIAYDEEHRSNVNAGTTRRRGVEARLDWQATPKLRVRAGLALIDATFRGGFPQGTSVVAGAGVPLVARSRAMLRVSLGPWRRTSADLTLQHLGGAPLSNDFDASEPHLAGRRLVGLALRTELGRVPGLALELSGENLLDDRHPSRGIESWGVRYFTPPAPRSVTLGIAWHLR